MRYIYILALVGFCGPQLVACRKNSKVSWLYGAVKIATVKIKWRNFGTDLSPRKRHCLAKLTLYVHICHVCDGLYASWRVKTTLRYRFKTLDRKPRPYHHPTTPTPPSSLPHPHHPPHYHTHTTLTTTPTPPSSLPHPHHPPHYHAYTTLLTTTPTPSSSLPHPHHPPHYHTHTTLLTTTPTLPSLPHTPPPFLFCNYRHRPGNPAAHCYPSTTDARVWEAIMASTAAPGYLEEVKIGPHVYQVTR